MATDLTLAALAFVIILAVLGAIFYGINKSSSVPENDGPKAQTKEEISPQGTSSGRRGGTSRMQARKRLQGRGAPAEASRPTQNSDSDSNNEEEDSEEEKALSQMSKKDRKKLEKQQEQEAKLAQRDQKEKKHSAYDELRRTKQDQKEAIRKAQEDEIRQAEEARIKKQDEEDQKWMKEIVREEGGEGGNDDQMENQGLLGQFIDYIKQRKTVPLEQLATEFKLRTTDVIDRINGLEAMGRLTGVMDERGKYIYISMEEMQAVANFINSKGRVAISDLASKSNTFIDLEAKATSEITGPTGCIDFDDLVGVEAANT